LKKWKNYWKCGKIVENVEKLLRMWKKYWKCGNIIENVEILLKLWKNYWECGKSIENVEILLTQCKNSCTYNLKILSFIPFFARNFPKPSCVSLIQVSVPISMGGTVRRFKSRGPLVFLRIFLLRNAPAGNHQLVAEDLMEDGTVMPTHSGEEEDNHQHRKSKNCDL
jgi:hypothetical protein